MNEQEGANFGMAHCSSHVKSLVLLLYLPGSSRFGIQDMKIASQVIYVRKSSKINSGASSFRLSE